MKQVSVIKTISNKEWDEFVRDHPYGWIFHLSDWALILTEVFPHIRPHYLIIKEKGSRLIQAGLCLFEVKSWLTGNRLVSLPYATLCDPLICSAEDFRILLDASIELKNRVGCKYVEIRAFKTKKFIVDSRLTIGSNYKQHYLTLDKEPQDLMRSFHRTCIRQRIRRAEESKVEVKEGTSDIDFKEFYHLYLKTRRRLRLVPQPYRFIYAIWNHFSPLNVSLLLAQINGQSIGGIILLKFKERVSAEYAALDEDFLHVSPNHLLFWTAIKEAYEQGYKIFDFGRTALDNRGLMDFKRRWGTKVEDLIHMFSPNDSVRMLRTQKGLSRKVLASLCNKAPEPIFKAIGNYCHRHMG